MSEQGSAKRIYGLDILRSIAIMSVVIGHSLWIVYGLVTPGSIIDMMFIFVASVFGYIGVEIFFVLSGFLIGSIFIRELVKTDKSELGESVRHFWLKRWFRTLPNYYLYLLFYLFAYWFMDWKGFEDFTWRYLVFVHNFFSSGPGFFGVAWSLSVEEWFYLLLPVLFTLGYTAIRNKNTAFKLTILLLFIIPFSVRIGYVLTHISQSNFSTTFAFSVIYRLDSIAYGVFLAWIWSIDGIKQRLIVAKKKLFVAGISSFAVFLVYLLAFVYKNVQNPLVVLISYPWATFSIMLCFPFMITLPMKSERWPQRMVGFISKISYSLYLAHPLFIRTFESFNDAFKPSPMIYPLYFLLVIAASFLLSYITYRYCEQPFLALRERVLKKKPKAIVI
ncbi:MAG: acyltransferase [Bacteroidota bacterium]